MSYSATHMADALYLGFWTMGGFVGFGAGVLVLRARRACSLAGVMALGIAWGGLILGAKWQYQLEHLPAVEALLVSPREVLGAGMRLPLGILTGGLLAGLWCFATRAPWRETGDALAVGAFALSAVGRVGCVLNRCCMGTVCGRWALPVCVRFPPDTESYNQQLREHLIPLSAPLSLPAHPLPLYFGATSLGILALLLWLLKRGAPAGSLLATACILGPFAKLALERLRADPRPAALMTGIPLATLVGTVMILSLRSASVAAARRGGPTTGSLPRTALSILLALASVM